MKIKELIEILRDENSEAEVFVRYWRTDTYGGADLVDYWLGKRDIYSEKDSLIIGVSEDEL